MKGLTGIRKAFLLYSGLGSGVFWEECFPVLHHHR